MKNVRAFEIVYVEPLVMEELLKGREDKPICSDKIIYNVNQKLTAYDYKYTSVKLRNFINMLRQAAYPILSDRRGYYISYDDGKQIKGITPFLIYNQYSVSEEGIGLNDKNKQIKK